MRNNADQHEIHKFDAMASQWWDLNGPCKPLHDLNPFRLKFIETHVDLNQKNTLDIGCGGGILSEALALKGAKVTGVDLSKAAINTAKLHALESQLNIDYHCLAIEEFAPKHQAEFDVITCMELLEHVPNPKAFIDTLAACLKPEGHLFLSTLNRTPKAYLQAIIGAEYVLRLLPRGTHEYSKFIKPSELSQMLRGANLNVSAMAGMTYNPFNKRFKLTDDVSVNYLIASQKS